MAGPGLWQTAYRFILYFFFKTKIVFISAVAFPRDFTSYCCTQHTIFPLPANYGPHILQPQAWQHQLTSHWMRHCVSPTPVFYLFHNSPSLPNHRSPFFFFFLSSLHSLVITFPLTFCRIFITYSWEGRSRNFVQLLNCVRCQARISKSSSQSPSGVPPLQRVKYVKYIHV